MREAGCGLRLVGSRLWGPLLPLRTVQRVRAAVAGPERGGGQRES